jgi:FkbM family methyltransferase
LTHEEVFNLPFPSIRKIVKNKNIIFQILLSYRVIQGSYINLSLDYLTKRKLTSNYLISTGLGVFNLSKGLPFDVLYSLNPITEFQLEQKLRNLREYDLFLDVGAYIGKYSIVWGSLFPNSRIISVEANREAFDKLEKNIRINNLENVFAYNLIASNVDSLLPYPEIISSVNSVEGTYANVIPTLALPLDTLIEGIGVKPRSLAIKIDVEGHELQVLEGLIITLSRIEICFVAIEILEGSSNVSSIFEILTKLDFQFIEKISGHNYIFVK